jgi:MFS family permease
MQKPDARNICSATAQDVRTMIIGRLLAGIGIGISSALVPLYISEVLSYIKIIAITVQQLLSVILNFTN